MKQRMLSGIKPTGELTLGNYIGAIRQFVNLQDEYESFVFIADLHALTIYNDPKELKRKIRDIAAIYLACGLDPTKTTIFLQSDNLYHANLSWILECNSYIGELSRMTQFKDKSRNNKQDNIGCGLFTYPVLMASDILLYDTDIVPVGIDQVQHVEIARDIANRFNNKYGNTFKLPKAVLAKEGIKIKDLQDPTKKMSKSSGNDKGCIMLLDEPNIARKKIMSAVTDSDTTIKYDEKNKPGISNLITIYSALTNKNIDAIEKEFVNKNYGEFKSAVSDVVVAFLTNLQSKYNSIISSDIINKVLEDGLAKTNTIASKKYLEIRKKIGIIK